MFFSIVVLARSQDITIRGTVLDENRSPLPGATILIQGTSEGTTADFDGVFSLVVSQGDTISISYLGYITQNIEILKNDELTILLKENASLLDEVIVTGYTSEKKSDIAGAISIVKIDQASQEFSPNILTALQGRVAGIQITSDGTPGGNGSQIAIRGLNSINASVGPLWVIDGVQTFNPSSLNPDEIESIQVLKDGSSVAIYGTSGANGVIVVTTKGAKEGQSEWRFKAESTVNTIRDKIQLLNSKEWASAFYKAQLGAGITTPTHPILINNGSGFDIPEFVDEQGIQRASNTDWVGEITGPAISSNIDLSYSKGTKNFSLYTSANYTRDNGIQKYTYYDRLNYRINSSFNLLNDKLKLDQNLLLSYFNEVKGNEFENAVLQNPLIPVYATDGSYAAPGAGGLQDKPNPLANLWSNQDNVTENARILGNVGITYELFEGLKVSSRLNLDYTGTNFDTATRPFSLNGAVPTVFNNFTISDYYSDFKKTIFSNLVTYEKSIGKGIVSLLAGVESTKQDIRVRDYIINGVDISQGEYQVRGDAEYRTNRFLYEYRKKSEFGRFKYAYDNRYIFSASVRQDGSSRFGPNQKTSVFKAGSLAWNVSNESFLRNSKTISNLKLRASYGENGNDEGIPDYLYIDAFLPGSNAIEFANYDIDGDGNGASPGLLSARQANLDIKWEATEQRNIGIDLGLFNNKFTITADYFEKQTNDLIIQPISQAITGESLPPFINAGNVKNTGFEVVASIVGGGDSMVYNNTVYSSTGKAINSVTKHGSNFKWAVDFNLAHVVNEVTSLDTDGNFLLNNGGLSLTDVGHPIASFYGLIADGIFRTPEEVAVHADQPGKALGRIRYRDFNNDGIINADDRTIIGNPHPDFTYGMNFSATLRNWDFALFFDGKQGNDLYNVQRELLDFAYFGFNFGRNILDAWSPANANSNIPAISTLNSNNELQRSSYYVEDGSYFRLKNISVGYSFDNLRLYLVGQNLFTITSFTGFDYEVSGLSSGGIGIAGYGVPHAKSISIGASVNF